MRISIFLSIVFCFSNACSNNNQSAKETTLSNSVISEKPVMDTIEVHFQEGFNNYKVKILQDNTILFEELLTTDDQSGFAGLYNIHWNYKNKYVIVVDSDTLCLPANPKKKYIRVTYSQEYHISIEWFDEPFLYE